MEHEVYVPFAAKAVRAALTEPERVARCVPGLQPDTSEPVPGDGVALEGRLRVRIGGSSITYRGTLRLTPDTDGEDGRYTVRGEGAEARGDGSVGLTLTVVPRPAGDGEGTVLVCAAELRGSGRITEYEEKQRLAAGRRLLDRFGGELAASMAADPVGPVEGAGAIAEPGGIGAPDDNEPVIPGIPAPETPESVDARSGGGSVEPGEPEEPGDGKPADEAGRSDEDDGGEAAGVGETPGPTGVFETEVPPPSLEPVSDEFGDGFDDGLDGEFDDTFEHGLEDGVDGEQRPVAAEAAHARRTMIGRSAEEVDHAPPRGRYAPVPPPRTAPSALAVLRWAAPAAVLVLASAVVLGRVLRRRR
ncbi:MAG TPA: SRPBCC domain-containing protein [Streptomyces sp.]|nr:SRPBCC domain-containing protein [Streptomyces sp.]